MAGKYRYLTFEDRQKIEAWHAHGDCPLEIAALSTQDNYVKRFRFRRLNAYGIKRFRVLSPDFSKVK